MLNESLILLSFNDLKILLLNEVTIFHIAVVYVLMYVVYKALGRYIYFKTQEHASKVNRTFLTLSILIVILGGIHDFTNYLPFISSYRWLYVLCSLVILIAPLSILMYRIIWRYDKYGQKRSRDWHYNYLPIPQDYYKTSISKSESTGSNSSYNFEEEGVESTNKNIHSDALLNLLALLIFIIVNAKWTYDSSLSYGSFSYIFSGIICLTITGIFFDQGVFLWISYLEKKLRHLFFKNK